MEPVKEGRGRTVAGGRMRTHLHRRRSPSPTPAVPTRSSPSPGRRSGRNSDVVNASWIAPRRTPPQHRRATGRIGHCASASGGRRSRAGGS